LKEKFSAERTTMTPAQTGVKPKKSLVSKISTGVRQLFGKQKTKDVSGGAGLSSASNGIENDKNND
jgi:hypothetical protein